MNNLAEHRIIIDRWGITYLAPGDDPLGEDLRGRLDNIVRTDVADACERTLHLALDPGDPSVWRIRRLVADLGVGADRWGAELAASIARVISRGEENGCVIRFPNRAAYLAQFARDLAAGRAWGKWYYQEFESLSALSPSRGICQALTRDPADAPASILALMGLNRLQEILCILTRDDARSLFQACCQNPGDSSSRDPHSRWIDKLLQIWADTPYRASGQQDNPYRDGLWWFAVAASRYPGAGNDPSLLVAIDGLLDLRRVLSSIPSTAIREQIVQGLANHRFSDALLSALTHGATDPERALELLADSIQGDLHWATEAIGVLLGGDLYRRATAPEPIKYGPAIPASFPGIFRLGPSFVASGIADIITCLPDSASAPVLLHLLAIKCLGGERADASSHDSALKTFSGFSADIEDPALQPQLDLAAAHRALRAALKSAGRPAGKSWLADVLPTAPPIVILRDVHQDEWLSAAFLSDTVRAEFAALSAELTEAPPSAISWHGLDASEIQPPSGPRPIDRDLAYFSLHGFLPQLDPEFDLFLTLTARAILKHFARRLPGFASSSPDHLYQNFLTGPGFLRDTGDTLEVELPPVPLSLVLRLAGIHDENYSLPWKKGRQICIVPWTL